MAYVTQADLEKRWGAGDLKTWTDDRATGATDTGIVAEAIAGAGGQIDGAAGQNYTTPLSLGDPGTAALVRTVAGSIAGYLLAARRPRAVPDNIRQQYDDAQAWLKELAAGRVSLRGETQVAAPRPTGAVLVAGTAAAAVTRETMDGL